MTTTPVRERRVAVEEDLGPPFALLLYNDDVNSMAHVVESLLHCVPDLDHAQAAEVMLEAHSHGMAMVTTGPRDRMAGYRNCLESQGLTATIEPV